ncbi:hypothetical protein CDAR_219071 [Caerostris darwini]|uniref:Uncharacterized protein n=1 Tax=Caerostris darwini TaxID=1538125 RepID=A0AAV4VSA2_9ARAC|nr:hypothetical protein CDAR_219071 [Caerostris darwini]
MTSPFSYFGISVLESSNAQGTHSALPLGSNPAASVLRGDTCSCNVSFGFCLVADTIIQHQYSRDSHLVVGGETQLLFNNAKGFWWVKYKGFNENWMYKI